MIWITSDWHFNHNKNFIWEKRNFKSVEEMNNYIIKAHNSIVESEDDVYVLGDLMLGDIEAGAECIRQMNGRLHIVRGNHDTNKRIELYRQLPNVVEIKDAIYLRYKKYHFYLSHFPTITGNIEKEAVTQTTLNLYGHTHQDSNFYENNFFMYHVGVDSHNCNPILLDNIIKEIEIKFRIQNNALSTLDFISNKVKEVQYFLTNCNKCIWQYNGCPGNSTSNCPTNFSYKRDPPDGGYYG